MDLAVREKSHRRAAEFAFRTIGRRFSKIVRGAIAKHFIRHATVAQPSETISARSAGPAAAQVGQERADAAFELRVDLGELAAMMKLMRSEAKSTQHRQQK